MRLVYSVAADFAGDGLGRIAYHSLRAAHAAGALGRVWCASHRPTEMDAVVRDVLPAPLGWIEDRACKAAYRAGLFRPVHGAHAALLDALVARRLGSPAAFFGWQGDALFSLEAARRRGVPALLECCNAHVDLVQEVLSRERAPLGLGASESEGWVRRLRAEYERADLLCCPSGHVERSFLERGVAPGRLVRVPYGVELERFRPAPPRDAPFRAVFAGDDMLRKGVLVLLRAWRALAPRDAELLVCGNVHPRLRARLEAERSAGVVLRGHVRDMAAVYREADVAVLPTFEDGFGLVLLEAMASGLPVVATPASAAPDLVEEGRDGFVVPAGDAEALAERLRLLHRDRDRARRMGAAARVKAELFPWERRAEGIRRAIDGLVAG